MSGKSCTKESPPVPGPSGVRSRIQLYGWDSRQEIWSGPNELSPVCAGSQRLAAEFKAAPGRSWYGPVTGLTLDEPEDRFFALEHDLGDCAVAMIYCDESKTGPVEIVAVLPASRRSSLRPEFAFEFLAFAGFLGAVGKGGETAVHEGISSAVAETAASDALVVTISSGLWASDLDHVLSGCVQRVAIAMLRWLRKP
jgi:hypothetical protein